ncbi:hypothetical protein JOQ06_026462, partial [Pogonophryne albipinna]
MHITIREGRSLPDFQRLFHPAKLSKVQAHLESHFNRAVLHEGNTIHRCEFNCRPQCYFYCFSCLSTLIRKADFIKHLALCKGLPHQICGNDGRIVMLMMDMPLIRKWWCLLLVERFEIQGHGQRFAFWTLEARSLLEGTLQPVFRVPRQSARKDLSQEKLPEGIIWRILGFVALEDGDHAICTLALTCKNFNYIVSQWSFQKETHFNWLDSVVNWNLLTEGHKREFRKAYQMSRCFHCDDHDKDVGTGYRGSGRRGILMGN